MERNNLIKKGVVVSVILLFIGVSIAPSINSEIIEIDSEPMTDDNVEFIFIGFIRSFEIGVEGNYSYLYVEYLYTLVFYYHRGDLLDVNIYKYSHASIISYKKANLKGYIGSFFICAKLSFDPYNFLLLKSV